MKKTITTHIARLISSLIFIFTILFFSCESFENSPFPDIKPERKAPLPDGGRSSAVSFVVDGKAYVALGRSNELKNNCFQYNPQTDNWKEMAPFPGIARVNASAATIDDEAFVGLGYNSDLGVYNYDAVLKDFWKYNPKTDSWTRLADFPAISTNKCICFTYDEKIYVGFGFSVNKFENDMWVYDPKTDTWTELPKKNVPSRSGGVSCVNSDYMYFGTGYNTRTLNDWWQYNPLSNDWKQLRDIPGTGRITAVAFSLDERIFVATGMLFRGNLTGGHVKDDILEYDTQKNVWYHRGTIPGGGRENAVSFVVDGKAYIGFGENENGVLNDLWVIGNIN